LNRTIGTGIFAQPSNVLYLVQSPAVAVILWFVGGLIILCITLSWLELGLSVPYHWIQSAGDFFPTPRSGGDKNYLEYIYRKPRLFMSCVFGITFIVFGNLAGNAIQFGIYMQTVVDPTCSEGQPCYSRAGVVGWAILVLLLCSFLNVTTRRLFIGLNNGFAIVKYLAVTVVAFLGIIYGSSHGDGCRTNLHWSNRGPGAGLGDTALATFFAMYSYTGFEQPFYVLAEVRRPQRYFAKYVLLALGSVMVLFPLTNVGFMCVVPYDPKNPEAVPVNMALEFFHIIAQGGNVDAVTSGSQRGISAMLAIIIFGTIMAQTFTGTRVKQEIGKEFIGLPWSLAIATGSESVLARLHRYRTGGARRPPIDRAYIDDHPEQVPMAATVLHLLFAVLLVVIFGAAMRPSMAYRFLTYLRVFSIIVVLGLLTVAGLAYLKIDSWLNGVVDVVRRRRGDNEAEEAAPAATPERPVDDGQRGRRWLERRQWRPWLDPLPTFVACAALALLFVTAFVPPGRIRLEERDVPPWAYPVTGLLVVFLGVFWWAGLRYWQWKTLSRTEVFRWPHVVVYEHEALLRAEIIEHRVITTRPRKARGG